MPLPVEKCPKCGYSLGGLATSVCPECGVDVREHIDLLSSIEPRNVWGVRGLVFLLLLSQFLTVSIIPLTGHGFGFFGMLFVVAFEGSDPKLFLLQVTPFMAVAALLTVLFTRHHIVRSVAICVSTITLLLAWRQICVLNRHGSERSNVLLASIPYGIAMMCTFAYVIRDLAEFRKLRRIRCVTDSRR